jgi:hypothetical protein
MFPCSYKHGPLYNYGDGSGVNYGVYCPNGGCGHGGCGHDGCGHGGHWGPWNRSAGCGDGCGHGHGLLGHHGKGCDACRSEGGHYARQTFANVFGRLHPTAHKCGQTCGLDCGGDACGGDACGGCGGHARAGWFAHHGCGGDGCGHGLGGHLGHHGCGGADGCGHGSFGHHGGCDGDGCGGHGAGLFGIRANLCGGLCHPGCCAGGGYGGANYQGYGVQAAGLNKGPWYLYWPTPNNLFQVPGPNAVGWAGNHFVLPSPYGLNVGVGGPNPYFPASAQVPAPPAGSAAPAR